MNSRLYMFPVYAKNIERILSSLEKMHPNLGKNEGDLMRVVYIGVKDFYEFKKFLFWKLKTLQDKCLNYQLNTNANIFGKIWLDFGCIGTGFLYILQVHVDFAEFLEIYKTS